MKRLIFIFVLLLSMVGCSTTYSWRMEYRAMTQAEKDAVNKHVESILNNTTKRDLSLAGSDQDWDDYARIVYMKALEINCTPRMFEYEDGSWELGGTGRWRYMEEYSPNQEPKVETTTTR